MRFGLLVLSPATDGGTCPLTQTKRQDVSASRFAYYHFKAGGDALVPRLNSTFAFSLEIDHGCMRNCPSSKSCVRALLRCRCTNKCVGETRCELTSRRGRRIVGWCCPQGWLPENGASKRDALSTREGVHLDGARRKGTQIVARQVRDVNGYKSVASTPKCEAFVAP